MSLERGLVCPQKGFGISLKGVWQHCHQCEGRGGQYQIARFVSYGSILASPVASPPTLQSPPPPGATRECLPKATVTLSAAVG